MKLLKMKLQAEAAKPKVQHYSVLTFGISKCRVGRKELPEHIVECLQKWHGVRPGQEVTVLNLKDWFAKMLATLERGVVKGGE